MRAHLASSGLRMAPIRTPVHYKIAENQYERAAAFRLCHDAYVRAGLMLPNRFQMRIMPHHLLATSAIFIAVQGDRVIATVSLVGDGRLGLPMESVYQDEIGALRDPRRWLGEVSSLASDPEASDCQLHMLGDLTRLMAQYAMRHGLEYLLAAVHPRHARYYQRVLGFQPLSEPRPYPAVRHRPSVALLLDLPQLEHDQHPAFRAYFRESIPDHELQFRPISGADRKLFAPAVTGEQPSAAAARDQSEGSRYHPSLQRAIA